MLTLWNRPGLCTLDPTWLFVNLHLHHWVQRLCYLMHIVTYIWLSRPLWCSMYQYSYRKLNVAYNDAFRHLLHEPRWCSASQFLWPMCLRLLPIFVNWCRLFFVAIPECFGHNVLINAALRSDLLARSPVFRRWRKVTQHPVLIFSKRERITLRLLMAIAIPSVVCRLSVCLWRWCALHSRLKFSAIFFHHTIAQGL